MHACRQLLVRPYLWAGLRLALFWAGVLLTSDLLLIAQAKPKPVWTVDLKKYGFRGPRSGLVNDPGSSLQLAFSGDSVAVLFDEKSETVPQKGTDTKTWLGWRFVGLFLNAKTGELLGRRFWITDLLWRKQLFPTASGGFLLLTTRFPRPLEIPTSSADSETLYGPHPTTLLLLSPTGEELKRLELPIHGAPKDEHWEAHLSPSRRSLLMTHVEGKSCELVLFDADSLTQNLSWKSSETVGCRVGAVSDEQMQAYGEKGRHLIGRFGDSLDSVDLPSGHSLFLTNNLIVTFGILPWGTAWITKPTGEQVSTIHFEIFDPGPSGVRPGVAPPFSSSDGRRVGTVIGQTVGPILFQREQHTLYVWQVPENKLVFTTEVKSSWLLAIQAALCDDGSRVAVVGPAKVLMYDLPVP